MNDETVRSKFIDESVNIKIGYDHMLNLDFKRDSYFAYCIICLKSCNIICF